MVEAEVAAALGINPGALRRNVVTRAVRLDTLVGARFCIGDAELVGVRRGDPCRYLDALTRPDVEQALEGRGGLRVHIAAGDQIRVGDAILVVPSARP